ncbi:hypothetical protein C8R45DRAFT_1073746 [Mycena sanguinolenta]|nr:hypothetical protein C8R45DRAFT_1073746 [Mycena sanguinolenta]
MRTRFKLRRTGRLSQQNAILVGLNLIEVTAFKLEGFWRWDILEARTRFCLRWRQPECATTGYLKGGCSALQLETTKHELGFRGEGAVLWVCDRNSKEYKVIKVASGHSDLRYATHKPAQFGVGSEGDQVQPSASESNNLTAGTAACSTSPSTSESSGETSSGDFEFESCGCGGWYDNDAVLLVGRHTYKPVKLTNEQQQREILSLSDQNQASKGSVGWKANEWRSDIDGGSSRTTLRRSWKDMKISLHGWTFAVLDRSGAAKGCKGRKAERKRKIGLDCVWKKAARILVAPTAIEQGIESGVDHESRVSMAQLCIEFSGGEKDERKSFTNAETEQHSGMGTLGTKHRDHVSAERVLDRVKSARSQQPKNNQTEDIVWWCGRIDLTRIIESSSRFDAKKETQWQPKDAEKQKCSTADSGRSTLGVSLFLGPRRARGNESHVWRRAFCHLRVADGIRERRAAHISKGEHSRRCLRCPALAFVARLAVGGLVCVVVSLARVLLVLALRVVFVARGTRESQGQGEGEAVGGQAGVVAAWDSAGAGRAKGSFTWIRTIRGLRCRLAFVVLVSPSSAHVHAHKRRSLSPEAAYVRGGSTSPESVSGSSFARGGSMSPAVVCAWVWVRARGVDEFRVRPRAGGHDRGRARHRAPPARLAHRVLARRPERGTAPSGWRDGQHGGLDPSMLLGFVCRDEAEWVDLRRRIKELPRSIFAIQDEPPTWPGADNDDMFESISDPEEEVDVGVDVSSTSHAASSTSHAASSASHVPASTFSHTHAHHGSNSTTHSASTSNSSKSGACSEVDTEEDSVAPVNARFDLAPQHASKKGMSMGKGRERTVGEAYAELVQEGDGEDLVDASGKVDDIVGRGGGRDVCAGSLGPVMWVCAADGRSKTVAPMPVHVPSGHYRFFALAEDGAGGGQRVDAERTAFVPLQAFLLLLSASSLFASVTYSFILDSMCISGIDDSFIL